MFYLETSQLFCSANQCNSRLKWVKEGNKEGHINSSAQKNPKFSFKDWLSKCDQIRKKLRIWSYLLKESLMENFFVQCND